VPLPKNDANVLFAVNNAASFNGIQTPVAYYTTIKGRCVKSDGSTAPPPCDAVAGAVKVGNASGGLIPTVNYEAANGGQQCPLPPGASPTTPAMACGVAVGGSRGFNTYVAGVVGINQLTASAGATAVSGAVVGGCPGNVPCGFLPVTLPLQLSDCNGQNKWDYTSGTGPWLITDQPPYTGTNERILPICGTGPGSVGWLNFTPSNPNCSGNGAAYIACDITNPANPPLTLPAWINTQNGNTNASQVDTAVNIYDNQVVLIPIYDCTGQNIGQQIPATTPCPNPWTGNGAGLYYRITALAPFLLDHAYINGNPAVSGSHKICDGQPWSAGSPSTQGNGATGCLKGWFVDALITDTTIGIGGGTIRPPAFGVQLIR
jgi:hypothetical protein